MEKQCGYIDSEVYRVREKAHKEAESGTKSQKGVHCVEG